MHKYEKLAMIVFMGGDLVCSAVSIKPIFISSVMDAQKTGI